MSSRLFYVAYVLNIRNACHDTTPKPHSLLRTRAVKYVAAKPKCLVCMWAHNPHTPYAKLQLQTPKVSTHTPYANLQLQIPKCQLHILSVPFHSLHCRTFKCPCNFICVNTDAFYEQNGTVHSLANQLEHAQRTRLRMNVGQLGTYALP
jgi:hypothetical protein